MRKILLLHFGLILTVFMSVEGWSTPRTESYRSAATAGMFKNNYDRLSDNPAYVGAKKEFIDYSKVSSDEAAAAASAEKKATDLYTSLDGLNADGKFLLGTITDLGSMGLGGYLEIGKSITPYGYNNTYTEGSTSFTINGTGEGNDNEVIYTGVGLPYQYMETLSASQDAHSKSSNINAKAAVGGFDLGAAILGLSLERTTEYDGYSSGSTLEKYRYSYTNLRLADNFLQQSKNVYYKDASEWTIAAYNTNIGAVMPMEGALETIEITASFNIIQCENKSVGKELSDDTYTGVGSTSLRNTATGSEKMDGMEYGITLLTRENILGWSAATYITYSAGGLNPNSDRKTVYNDYSNTTYFGSTRVDTDNESLSLSDKGSGIDSQTIGLGIINRKEAVKGLLVGWGFNYSLTLSENKYTETGSYTRTQTIDDGDGFATNSDYTLVQTGSVTEKITEETVTQRFEIPIGIEFQATPSLSWRIGVIHNTTMRDRSNKYSVANFQELYNDYDYAGIDGNETDYDGTANNPSGQSFGAGGQVISTAGRGHGDSTSAVVMTNDYYLGIGYNLGGTLQLDLLFNATATNVSDIDTAQVSASATYSF